MKRLDRKVLLVAGGGADGPANKGETLAIGNGRAIAILCAREGARVMVTDRSLTSAQETAAAIVAEGGAADALEADVTDEDACKASVAAAVAKFGALHLMVNNVGIVYPMDDFSLETADYDHIMSVNLRGQFLMLKYAIPEIIKAGGGAIVLNSSMGAIRGGGATYGPSKAAINSMVRGVAVRYAKDKVRCNAVLPGLINSTLARRTGGEGRDAAVGPLVPMGRQGTPWEVAHAVLFLLSEEASYITGTELLVDGGFCATVNLAPLPRLSR
ncbi:MAG TPA: SDR family NAD(P)-dependent oxidoreductase [Candidatus Binataceae bacterium]|jgi:NAD(P)-dependent dehydrogenase (short-subunit alcohol dehydrogenase family)|nr:SDR family NAD(P)-dependent oxidoreductase [Candidatus Binataceae bacterium]